MNTTKTVRPAGRWVGIWNFPITRIVLAALFLGVGAVVAQLAGSLLVSPLLASLAPPRNAPVALATVLIALLAIYASYRAYVGLIEHRAVTELSFEKAGWELGAGLLLGLALFGLIIALLWLLGVYRVTGWNSWAGIIPALVANVPSGFLQEIFFRGVLFRIAYEKLGVWWALLISALVFGLIHLLTPNATLVSTLSIAAEAGILLAAAYLLTGRLWLAIGLHIAWDVANDGIFGVGTGGFSGESIPGMLSANLSGPTLLSGGANGVEASLVTFLVIAAACVYLLRRALRKKTAL